MALTPVATLIFRFNNPDALLTLLLVAGAYATVRALEEGATRWLVLAGACVGSASWPSSSRRCWSSPPSPSSTWPWPP
jgi:4-amino-4-deoxy-L-arabinose transferase-like glycosyltransferase